MRNSDFYGDLTVPGMLYAKLIHAPRRGILKTIAPGPDFPAGMYFYTANDIPGENRVQTLGTFTPVFAAAKARFEGEPVGIVAGESEEDAERAAANAVVEIEPDPNSAGAPQKILTRAVKNTGGEETEPSQDGLITVEDSYSISHTSGILSEPAGCVASFADGRLTVCCPTEWVSHLRENLSAALAIPASNIEITRTRVTSRGSTGVWYGTALACQAGLAAMRSGRAVKLVLSREEHTRLLENPMNCVITHKSSVASDGEIVSMNIEILADAGSGNPFAREILNRLAVSAAGIYRPKRLSVSASILSSAAPPACVFLPWVDYHCFFAAENHINSIAARAAAHPLDTRKINSTGAGAQKNTSPFNFDLKTSDAVLDTAASVSDFSRKYSAYEMQSNTRKAGNRQSFSEPVRGIGIASAFAPGAFYGTTLAGGGIAEQELEVTLEKDGEVTINTYQPSLSIKSIWTAIAAESLDVPAGHISIKSDFEPGREPLLPEQVYANISVMTQLLRRCCDAVQKQRFREPLPIKVKRAVPKTHRRVWDDGGFCGQPYHSTAPAAAVVEIELEPFTLRETIRGIWLVLDGGEILAAKQAEAALRRSIQDMLSSFVRRDKIDGGKISISFLPSAESPKQIGDAAYTVLPAAFAAALSQCASFPVRTLPIETDTIFRLMTEREALEGDG